MKFHGVTKIVSGGQTGVDQAALDVAIFFEMEHGGWCPKGRRSETGIIPDTYQLKELDSRDYSVRTEQNVVDSDGTLILFLGQLSGGTGLTRKFALKHKRPVYCVDLGQDQSGETELTNNMLNWLRENNITTLNVAGPRASSAAGIGKLAEAFLIKAFQTN